MNLSLLLGVSKDIPGVASAPAGMARDNDAAALAGAFHALMAALADAGATVSPTVSRGNFPARQGPDAAVSDIESEDDTPDDPDVTSAALTFDLRTPDPVIQTPKAITTANDELPKTSTGNEDAVSDAATVETGHQVDAPRSAVTQQVTVPASIQAQADVAPRPEPATQSSVDQTDQVPGAVAASATTLPVLPNEVAAPPAARATPSAASAIRQEDDPVVRDDVPTRSLPARPESTPAVHSNPALDEAAPVRAEPAATAPRTVAPIAIAAARIRAALDAAIAATSPENTTNAGGATVPPGAATVPSGADGLVYAVAEQLEGPRINRAGKPARETFTLPNPGFRNPSTAVAANTPPSAGDQGGDRESRARDFGPRIAMPNPPPGVSANAQPAGNSSAPALIQPGTLAPTPTVISTTVPVTVAPAAVDRRPDDTAAQIVQAIRMQVTRGGGEAHIRLQPDHFGEVTMVIRVDQGQVTARLQAESPVVREYLQSHQGMLREGLAEQNLTLGRFEVAEPPSEARDTERRSADERGAQQERHSPRRRQQAPGEPFEPFEVVA